MQRREARLRNNVIDEERKASADRYRSAKESAKNGRSAIAFHDSNSPLTGGDLFIETTQIPEARDQQGEIKVATGKGEPLRPVHKAREDLVAVCGLY